ncbi:MAG: hypothetical protein GKR89_06345 [Candidatus Latescibacteria bacterium]|nr:hypothetical protein [Candidatus Latescibacterota bacterium]
MQETYQHYARLRDELSRWLEQSMRMDGPGPNRGGEDEANYALTWFQHYLVSGEERIVERFASLLEELAAWTVSDCLHGYEPRAEAHHGTEPFLLFLPRYLGLFPQDGVAGMLLEDAAHHIGNWEKGVPPWYDYERDCFHSYQLGTRLVSPDQRWAFELAEHWRFVHIALAAHRVGGQARYLEWALRYGRQRARWLLVGGNQPVPVLWAQDGRGLQVSDLETAEQRRMAAGNHHLADDPLAGVENHLASGVIYALGDLYLLSGEELFKRAARRLVEPLVSQLLDPYADPAAAALSYYRWTFDDDSLDQAMRQVLAGMPPPPSAPWAMVFPQERRRREPGVGKRNDMIYWGQWGEDGAVQPVQEPSSAALSLAYQLTGQIDYAHRALAAAADKLTMARQVLRGGREHTDMGGAVCSVAAGHGRNWGCGAVTGCYGPLLLGTREILGAVRPLVEIRDASERDRVPEQILPLVRPPLREPGEVSFYNGGEQAVELTWRINGEARWRPLHLEPGAVVKALLE